MSKATVKTLVKKAEVQYTENVESIIHDLERASVASDSQCEFG